MLSSTATNTSVSDTFTIPMIESGIDKNRVAAIEAVSSSSGQILPL